MTTMSLQNINGTACATPVDGTPPCGKVAFETMLAADFGDNTKIVNFEQVASFQLSVPLPFDDFNETKPEGRAAMYKVKYAVATASGVDISRVAVELVNFVAGRRQLQTASETVVVVSVTSAEDLSATLDFDEFSPAFIENFEEPTPLPADIESALPNDWGVESCTPTETETQAACDTLGRCEATTEGRQNACECEQCSCSYNPGSIRRICEDNMEPFIPSYQITFDLVAEASGAGPCSLSDEEEALADFVGEMLFCDTCFGTTVESCVPRDGDLEAGDGDCARIDICVEDEDDSRDVCEANSGCQYVHGTPMVCQTNMSALIGSARGDGELPCTEQLQDQMSSWRPSGSAFEGANISASPAAVLCGDYAVPHSETICQDVPVGSRCNYTCADGYLPVGNAFSGEASSDNLVCMADGSFADGGCEVSTSPPPAPPHDETGAEEDSGLETWQVALIIAGTVTVTLAAVIQQVMVKRKRIASVMDDSNKGSDYAGKP